MQAETAPMTGFPSLHVPRRDRSPNGVLERHAIDRAEEPVLVVSTGGDHGLTRSPAGRWSGWQATVNDFSNTPHEAWERVEHLRHAPRRRRSTPQPWTNVHTLVTMVRAATKVPLLVYFEEENASHSPRAVSTFAGFHTYGNVGGNYGTLRAADSTYTALGKAWHDLVVAHPKQKFDGL